MNPELFPLDHPRAIDASVVGSKAAGLARLRAAGFDVPDGVVLPVGAAEAWPSGPPPDEWRRAVQDACATLDGPVAVRSSSTWEDAETSSHAGATATVLNVEGTDAVLDAIRHCFDASGEAQRSRDAAGAIAILIQRMVPADHAGVAFTADPVTGEGGLVRIAATKGLGEALVQGEVVGSDVTVRGETVEGDLADLPAADALAVARVARDIEALHGRPQDIEWAIADGSLHVLQARPITVVPVRPSLPQGNNWQKDLAHYPEPLTPFGWSVMQASADDVRAVFDETGLLVRGLEEVFVGGEIYGRVLPAFGSADSAGNPPPAVVMGLAARVVPELRRRNATARRVVETGQRQRWLDEWFETDRQEGQRRAAELREVDVTTLDDAGLARHHDDCVRLLRRGHPDPLPAGDAAVRGSVPAAPGGGRRAGLGRCRHRQHAGRPLPRHPHGRGRHGRASPPHPRCRGCGGGTGGRPPPSGPGAGGHRCRARGRAAGVDRRARLGAGQLRRRGPGAGGAAHDRDPSDPRCLPGRARRRRPGRRHGLGRRCGRRCGPASIEHSTRPGPSTRSARTTRSSWAIDRWRCCADGCSRWPAGWPSGASSRRRPTRPTCTSTSCAPRCSATTPETSPTGSCGGGARRRGSGPTRDRPTSASRRHRRTSRAFPRRCAWSTSPSCGASATSTPRRSKHPPMPTCCWPASRHRPGWPRGRSGSSAATTTWTASATATSWSAT